MNRRFTLAIVGLAAVATSVALAQNPRDNKPAAQTPPADHGQFPLPPGWTEADIKACEDAGTPGPNHLHLAEGAGVWNGKSTMWMYPGAEPIVSECSSTITPILDGRFTKCEMSGSTPMGPFTGFGIYGFDNITEKFQSTWIDNCSTTIMIGTGEPSSDGSTMTWTYKYTCPVSKKPVTLREIERTHGKDSKSFEMYGIDPKSGKEFKMMEVAVTRRPGTGGGAH